MDEAATQLRSYAHARGLGLSTVAKQVASQPSTARQAILAELAQAAAEHNRPNGR